MSVPTVEPETSTADKVLADRCKLLGLPTWRMLGTGGELTQPSGWGPADHWLQAPLLTSWIDASVQEWVQRPRTRVLELFSGCWLIPLAEGEVLSNTPVTVAMALGSDALTSEQFLAVCGNARLDASITRASLAPLARFRRSDHDRLASVLRWMHADLTVAAADRAAIKTFTRELSESYEQISHLYRLSRSINQLSEPDEFVRRACQQLYDLLDFEWIAVKVIPLNKSSVIVNDTLVIFGRPMCSRKELDREGTQLAQQLLPGTPTVVLEPDTNELAMKVGGSVLADPITSADRIVGVLLAGGRSESTPDISSIESQLLRATAEFLGSFIHSAVAYHEQRTMFLGTIRAITSTIEAKDRYTRGHSERVAYLASQLAEAAGIDANDVPRVRLAGMLHDVGKIGIRESVLQKPGQLTEEEFQEIKRHPVIGYTIIRDIEPLQDILPGVLYHHERWDGSGYPQGLAGEQIPLIARLLSVADMFDAMSSDRAYRTALPRERILQEVEQRAGTQLDPELARVFLTLDLAEYDRMIARHLEQDCQAVT
ncbi:MAG: HD domain-containing phosphohydrolase [Planctomycetota bacterium]